MQWGLEFIVETINKTFQSIGSYLSTISYPEPPTESEVPVQYIISVQDMEKCLMRIKISKAPGHDGVPNWVPQDFAPVLAEPISSIVNSSVFYSEYTEKC